MQDPENAVSRGGEDVLYQNLFSLGITSTWVEDGSFRIMAGGSNSQLILACMALGLGGL